MIKGVVNKLTVVSRRCAAPGPVLQRSFTDRKDEAAPRLDASLLDVLVCPLSKKPLRYDPEANELINEELGIAYPVLDGIPNMIPEEARLVHKDPAE